MVTAGPNYRHQPRPAALVLLSQGSNNDVSYFVSQDVGLVPSTDAAYVSVQLLGLVTRRRYGEIREKDLEGHSLQRSLMDMRFHVRDLIGMGALQRVQTTSGALLRAPKRK